MKIFALNLCLSLSLSPSAGPFQFATIDPDSLEQQLARDDADQRQWFVAVDDTAGPSPEQVFAWLTETAYRSLNSQIGLQFPTEASRTQWFERFRAQFRVKRAAGGLVQNEAGAYLCIYHRGRWTLPKGHIEKGESPEVAAQREVCEETGLPSVSIDRYLGETYHTYFEKGRWTWKTTYWYRMLGDGKAPLTPQADEQIEAARWLQKSEWLAIAHESYPLNRAIFEAEFSQRLSS